MGSGRDKKKKSKGKKPGVGAQKTARKSELNEDKLQRRLERKAQVRSNPSTELVGNGRNYNLGRCANKVEQWPFGQK